MRALQVNGDSARGASESPGGLSQSERDWAFAKRVLARGDRADLVIATIAVYRRFDNQNPQAYAEHTVRKAAASLTAERTGHEQPER
jgi:hypothetical protein